MKKKYFEFRMLNTENLVKLGTDKDRSIYSDPDDPILNGLNKLGLEGWELCSVRSDNLKGKYDEWYFKRKIDL